MKVPSARLPTRIEDDGGQSKEQNISTPHERKPSLPSERQGNDVKTPRKPVTGISKAEDESRNDKHKNAADDCVECTPGAPRNVRLNETPRKSERDERSSSLASTRSCVSGGSRDSRRILSARSSVGTNSEYLLSTRRDTSRSSTTAGMSTARAEATLVVLEAERAQLERRLKKVEEQLEREDALARKEARRGGARRKPLHAPR